MAKGLAALFALSLALMGGVGEDAFGQGIALFEDFDDGVADGFAEVGGVWEIMEGRYVQSQQEPGGPYRSWVDAGDLAEYSIEVDCTQIAGDETKIIYAHGDSSEDYRVDFWLEECRLCMPAWGEPWDTRTFTVGGLDLSYEESYHVRIDVGPEGVFVRVNDILRHEQPWADAEPLGDGKVGVGTYAAASSFDNLAVRAGPPAPETFFSEDFTDGVADGFVEVGGTWEVVDGEYFQSMSEPEGPYRSWVHAGEFTAYTVEVDFTPLSGEETKIIYAHGDGSEDYRVDFGSGSCRLCMPAWGNPWDTRNWRVDEIEYSYTETYHVRIDVGFEGVQVRLAGVLLHDQPWANGEPLGDGNVGVGNWAGASKFGNLTVSVISPGLAAFFGIDLRPAPGGVSLEWSRALFEKDSIFTVEFRDSLTEGEWTPLAPVDQWPTPARHCTDLSAADPSTRFYRIRGEGEFSEEVPGWMMPELAVTDLIVEPERVNPDEVMEFHATVSNVGRGTAGRAELVFQVEGEEIAREVINPLPPLGWTELTVEWRTDVPGQFLVIAELELGAETFDLGFENNARHATARVSGEEPPTPELEVDIASDVLSSGLVAGEPAEIPVLFRNPSFATLHNIPVHFYIDGEHVGDGLVEHVPPGEQQQLEIRWDVVTPGEHTISLQMDLPDDFPDAISQGVKGWQVIVPGVTATYDVAAKDKWASLGPQLLDNGDTGRITCFDFHPTNPSIMYAGGWGLDGSVHAATGVWKTTNGGLNWFPLGDKLPSMMISSIAVDPQSPINVYAGTPYNGIFKSRDSGNSWDLFASPTITGNYVSELIVRSESAPTTPLVVIYAATNGGVWRYTSDTYYAKNSTLSDWKQIKTGVITDLAVHPTDRDTVYASVENSGLYRTDDGVTASGWYKIGSNLPPISGWRGLVIDIYKSNPKYIYAGVRFPKTGYHFGIYRSKDEGDTFAPVKEYKDDEVWQIYNAFIRVHPTLLNMVYFGGVDFWQWSAYSPPPNKSSWTYIVDLWRCDMKDMKFLPSSSPGYPSTYYVACDQGMIRCTAETKPQEHYKNNDLNKPFGLAGDTSITRNNNLRVTEYYDFDVGTSVPPMVIGGTQDTGTHLYEGSPTWKIIRGGDGYSSLIAPSNNSILYSQHQGLVSTWRSGDTGKNWQQDIAKNKGLPDANAYITVDPNYPNTLLAACSSGDKTKGGQVFATTDADLGKNCTWTGRGPFGTNVNGGVTRVVIQPSTTHWFAGTSKGQIWHSSAKMQGTWSLLDSHPDKASVRSMTFSPKDHNVLYVLYSGGDAYRRIQRLWVSGSAWVGSWISDNLDMKTGPRVICGDAHRSDVAHVGTDHGVYRWDSTKPMYESWQPYNDGFPLTTVVDLKVGPDKMLYAATKGRGAWVVITGP